MKLIIRIMALASISLVASCATLNKDECLSANWEVIGYEDGTKGYAATRIGDHRKACAEHGVTPNLSDYTKGRDRGLKLYCTAANGFKVGQKTSVYRDVCPAELRESFRMAFAYGQQIYGHRRDINTFHRDILQYRENIHAMEEEQSMNEALIIRGARGPRERAMLITRNRELQNLIGREGDKIERAAYEVEQLEYLISELIENSPYR